MTNSEYWRVLAEEREAEAYKEASEAIEEMKRLYADALDDIDAEVERIKRNYQRRAGVDNEAAEAVLARKKREYNMENTAQLLLRAETEDERRGILDFIHRNGLSPEAYGARAERYQYVIDNIALRLIGLEMDVRALGEDVRRSVYRKNYYRVIDDSAAELNAGVNFSLIDEGALEEVMSRPWHGKRFSERVWDDVNETADAAREIVGRYIASGRSLDKAAAELSEAVGASEFAAETLIRTETAHARAMSDKKAYEDMGAEYYRFMASLDELTCGRCSPLDGRRFRLSEAVEGKNFPTMHPRCRCTTTADYEWKQRSARDPISGKSYKTDGAQTYNQWRENMTEEEKKAFEKAGRAHRNEKADKEQYAKYRERLGRENVPKSFDKWQDLKYNNSGEYEAYTLTYKNATGFIKGGLNPKTNKPRQIITSTRTDIRGIPNSITQVTNAKGGIDRNYYGSDTWQTKQISNHDHGHKAESGYGEHGEHVHDYVWNSSTKKADRVIRDLNDAERKENSDIL